MGRIVGRESNGIAIGRHRRLIDDQTIIRRNRLDLPGRWVQTEQFCRHLLGGVEIQPARHPGDRIRILIETSGQIANVRGADGGPLQHGGKIDQCDVPIGIEEIRLAEAAHEGKLLAVQGKHRRAVRAW